MRSNQTHNKLNGFFSELIDVHRIAIEKLESVTTDYEESTKQLKDIMEAYPEDTNPEIYYKAKADIEKMKKEYLSSVDSIKNYINERIVDSKSQIERFLDSRYKLDESKIDGDVISLLNSGVKLKSFDIESYLEKYQNNATMGRIICDFAESNKIESDIIRDTKKQLERRGTDEMERFNNATRYVTNMFSNDPISAKVYRNPRHVQRIVNESIKQNESCIYSADEQEE